MASMSINIDTVKLLAGSKFVRYGKHHSCVLHNIVRERTTASVCRKMFPNSCSSKMEIIHFKKTTLTKYPKHVFQIFKHCVVFNKNVCGQDPEVP